MTRIFTSHRQWFKRTTGKIIITKCRIWETKTQVAMWITQYTASGTLANGKRTLELLPLFIVHWVPRARFSMSVLELVHTNPRTAL